ncbi:MAG: DUF3168 domain-containing protein [Pseudomonadota bacterium]|nr:DUF3168 domain-containing protein [Pseudomonadota bacterium]
MSWLYQPLLPGGAELLSGAVGPTYTLTAEAGVFTLSGQAAGLLASRLLSAEAGAFALSGQAAGLLAARRIDAAAGLFTLSGQAAGLDYSGDDGPTYTLTAETGSLAFTGQAAGLRASRRLSAATGSFAFTGQAAGLSIEAAADETVVAGAGLFTVTGMPADLRVIGPVQTAPTTPLAVQKGILRAVTIAVDQLGAKVYDHVPHAQRFPFVAMDQHQVLQNDGCEIHGFNHLFYLSVWSTYRGSKEVWEILDAIWRGLHDQRLLLENGTHVLCQVTEQRAELDADGVTHQGSAVLRVHTNPWGND